MSPVPSSTVTSRIGEIQARIAAFQAMTSGSGGRLGPDVSFAESLSAQVAAQSGGPGATTGATTPAVGAGPLTPPGAGAAVLTPARPTPSPATPAVPAAPSTAGDLGYYVRPGREPLDHYIRPGAPAAAPSTSSDEAALTPGSDFGEAIVALASRHLGVDYVWGGESLEEGGFDCSGLIWHAYRQAGIELPRVSRDQARVGEAVASLDQARPGDLVAFGTPVDHIGIYAGDGMMVVAPHTGAQVRLQQITATPSAIRRIVPAGTVVADPAAANPAGAAPTDQPATRSSLDVPFAAELQAAAQRHGIDPRLLAAVARAESGFNPAAVSPAGASGLMQLMPGTAAELGVDPFDPAQAADGAARYLSTQLDAFGSIELALAAYNAGPGNVRRYGGIPPFNETQTYVRRVIDFMGAM